MVSFSKQEPIAQWNYRTNGKNSQTPLNKTLNGQLLTETGFYTVLTDIEACVNSRPIGTSSESPDDNNILTITPSHLIIRRSLKPLPTEIYKMFRQAF